MPRGVRKRLDLGLRPIPEGELEREIEARPVLKAFFSYRHAKVRALARDLRFVRRRLNRTRAALKAGASPRRASITGSEWYAMPKVQTYRRDLNRFRMKSSISRTLWTTTTGRSCLPLWAEDRHS